MLLLSDKVIEGSKSFLSGEHRQKRAEDLRVTETGGRAVGVNVIDDNNCYYRYTVLLKKAVDSLHNLYLLANIP